MDADMSESEVEYEYDAASQRRGGGGRGGRRRRPRSFASSNRFRSAEGARSVGRRHGTNLSVLRTESIQSYTRSNRRFAERMDEHASYGADSDDGGSPQGRVCLRADRGRVGPGAENSDRQADRESGGGDDAFFLWHKVVMRWAKGTDTAD